MTNRISAVTIRIRPSVNAVSWRNVFTVRLPFRVAIQIGREW